MHTGQEATIYTMFSLPRLTRKRPTFTRYIRMHILVELCLKFSLGINLDFVFAFTEP